ncbi:unknown protein [Seminavis robusta]|uniref:Uncharacterized protein n=1 Tax=Seminavis robusta TaxID=568900 RepID=A0A9N8EI27_9STRA|nr:unknown protein [Seminavis robusta]|eukprot:Sro1256_g256690.1 n/a (305) ;mRNA; f:31321-32235
MQLPIILLSLILSLAIVHYLGVPPSRPSSLFQAPSSIAPPRHLGIPEASSLFMAQPVAPRVMVAPPVMVAPVMVAPVMVAPVVILADLADDEASNSSSPTGSTTTFFTAGSSESQPPTPVATAPTLPVEPEQPSPVAAPQPNQFCRATRRAPITYCCACTSPGQCKTSWCRCFRAKQACHTCCPRASGRCSRRVVRQDSLINPDPSPFLSPAAQPRAALNHQASPILATQSPLASIRTTPTSASQPPAATTTPASQLPPGCQHSPTAKSPAPDSQYARLHYSTAAHSQHSKHPSAGSTSSSRAY